MLSHNSPAFHRAFVRDTLSTNSIIYTHDLTFTQHSMSATPAADAHAPASGNYASSSPSDRTVSDALPTPDNAVDPAAGEKEFNSLSRALTQEARDEYNKSGTRDPEKILEDEDFDLLEYLSSTTSAASQAGIKRKRVGVVWEDLEVLGQASMSLGVQTFPDAFVKNFGAPVFAIMKVSVASCAPGCVWLYYS